MISESVLIFSLEGKCSNTEVNFYTGLNFHLNASFLEIYAIGPQANKTSSCEGVKSSLRSVFQKSKILNIDEYKNIMVFFIGDGDVKEQIKPMERSMKTCKNEIENRSNKLGNKKFKFHDKLIYDKGLSFDRSFERIKGSKFYSPKKEGNKSIFNDYADSANWFDNNKLNRPKILEDLEKIETNHLIIFKYVFDNCAEND